MKKFIDRLAKDIANRTDTQFEKDIEYIKICLKMAYFKGRVDAQEAISKHEYL